MSVNDINKQLIITSCLTGKVICVIPYFLYSRQTILQVLSDITNSYIFDDEEGFQIKFGNML